MTILALDQATKTGWAFAIIVDKQVRSSASGVENFQPRAHESTGMRLVRFKGWLSDTLENLKPDLVIYESPHVRHRNAAAVGYAMSGLIETVCTEEGINYTNAQPKEIKRHATGTGNANKEMMVEAAKKRWPLDTIIDNNHADALWILDLAITRYAT